MNVYPPQPYREHELPPPPQQPAAPPRLWTLPLGVIFTAVVALGGFVATLGVFTVAFGVRLARAGRPASPAALVEAMGEFVFTAPGVLASGLVTALAFGGTALLSGILSDAGVRARLRLGPSRRWFATGLVAMLQLVGFGMMSSQVATLLGMSEQGSLPMLRRAFAHMTPPLTAMAVLIVGAGAGVAEELFFRGYLLTRLEQRVRPWLANFAVAMAFALAHWDLVHSTFALLVGVAQGWTSRRSGSIRPAIVAHTLNNVVGVFGMAMAGSSGPEPFSASELAGGAALLLVSTAGVWRMTRPAPGQPPSSGGAP